MDISKINNLPSKLKQNELFCIWKYELDEKGRQTKIPYNPNNPQWKAKSNDKKTFSTIEKAATAAEREKCGLGVGIFGSLAGIDIDHCIDDNGQFSEMAQDIVRTMNAYTEFSPSGTGLRILFYAPQFNYDKAKYYIKNSKCGLEVYIAGITKRFLTVTGNVIKKGDLEDRTAELQKVLDKYMKRPQTPSKTNQSYTHDILIDDNELIDKALKSKNGDNFSRLWNGIWENYYPSQSEADQALCNMLAFWTGKNEAQMDRIFRNSGLMRDKWDKKHGRDTYGNITIEKACASCNEVYEPKKNGDTSLAMSFFGKKTSNDIQTNENNNMQADEQEYQEVIELAKKNVLDKAVFEFANRFNDLSDFDAFFNELLPLADFQRKKTDFRNIMSRIRKNIEKQQQSEKQPFTIEVLQQFLNANNITIRENVITHEIVPNNLPESYNFDGSAAHLGTILYSELRKNGLAVAQNVVENYIMVIARQHSYNPVAEILKNKVWDGKDRLKELFEIMHIANAFQRKLIVKWLMQALTIALYNSEKEPISAEGVLVLVGEQAIGKTSLVRKLGITGRLCKTGLSLDCKNKDSVITAVSCFVGELGELETTFKSDISSLKAFFTQEFDTLRKPYGRSYEKVTRHSTYIATCNTKEFLIDESGNRRYWTIDCEKRFELDKLQNFDVIQLWLQVYDLIQKKGKQAFRLSPEELKELNTHNEKHEKKLKGQQEIEDILAKETDEYYKIVCELMTTTDFKNEWQQELRAYSAVAIGRVLDKLGYDVEVVERKNGKTARLRRLPKKLCYPTNSK